MAKSGFAPAPAPTPAPSTTKPIGYVVLRELKTVGQPDVITMVPLIPGQQFTIAKNTTVVGTIKI